MKKRGGRGIFWEENKDLKKSGGGEEYQVVGNFIHSCEAQKKNLELNSNFFLGGGRGKSIS